MPSFLLDTNCIIAAVCSWHEHHGRAAGEISRRVGRGETLLVAAPAIVEAYAVLTRLPAPHRLAPGDAFTLLETNFLEGSTLVALDGPSYRSLLSRSKERGISGGRVYDGVIAACAVKGRATAILTFNDEHFRPFAEGLEIVVPA